MIEFIKENKFQELKEQLGTQPQEFAIHKFLLDILNNDKVVIDGESFDARRYQEEFLEGLNIYSALELSNIDKFQRKKFLNLLVELAFKMAEFIQFMAKTAVDKGVYLSDLEDVYRVKPEIREKLQDFINRLKNSDKEGKAIANVAAAKAKISNSIGNILEKYEIGDDMLQFAASYETMGQTEMAIKVYQGIMNDFECESVKLSTGLFPEISHVDTRPKKEIEIFKNAKARYHDLTGEKMPEVKRIHVDDNENAKKIVSENFTNAETAQKSNFFERLIKKFKKQT